MSLLTLFLGAGGGGASLSGTFTPSTTPVNLTAAGWDDWASWNFLSGGATGATLAPTDRKAGGGSTISIASGYNTTGNLDKFTDMGIPMSWTDGTPHTSASDPGAIYNNQNGGGTDNVGFGISVTLPASTATRTARIYCSCWNGSMNVIGVLSDASATMSAQFVSNPPTGVAVCGYFEVTYAAGSAGQTLEVRIIQALPAGGYADVELAAVGVKVTGGTDTNLTPGAASITLAGPAPTVTRTANQSLVPGTKAIALTGYAPTVAQSGNVALVPGAGVITLTGWAPTVVNSGVPTWRNENDMGGGQKRQVYWRPLLQRMVDARQEDRPAPPKGRAKVRAKAIEQDAVRLVMDGGGTLAEFNQLLERWTAQHEVEEIQMDPLGAFVAAMRMRVEQAGEIERLAALAKQAARQRDDEEAAILLLLT